MKKLSSKEKTRIIQAILFILVFLAGLAYMCISFIQNEIEHGWWPKTINTCIEETNLDYDEIRTLICDPGPNVGLRSKDYDLLGKLTNLESITLIAMGSGDFVQDVFSELCKLKHLHTIIIEDSGVGPIDKLAEIESLTTLSIIGDTLTQSVIVEGGENEGFKNLKSLSFTLGCNSVFPDLTSIKNLEKLKVTGYYLSELPYDKVNWENIVSLDISYSSVERIDDRIITELSNLKELNIERSKISDMEFILGLPSLEKLTWEFDNLQIEHLINHPNFKENWLP